jgi:hypothetical protein
MMRYLQDWAIAFATLSVLWVAAALAIVLLCSCSHDTQHTSLEQRVIAATEEGWQRAGLPELGEHCDVDLFRIEYPTAEEFDRICYPATTETAHSCFVVRLAEHPAMELYSRSYPSAQIRPNELVKNVPGLAVHELLHGLVGCTLDRPLRDPWDYYHSDPRVWAPAQESAEVQARELLGE